MKTKTVVTIPLPNELHATLKGEAEKQSRSMASLGRQILMSHLDGRERPLDLAELLKSQRTGKVES